MTKRDVADESKSEGEEEATAPAHSFGVDLARNFGGALIFSFPLLMTMEMWWLGFYMDRFRLALFLVFVVVLVAGLTIEGELVGGGQSVETSDTVIEYLPPHSERQGGLFFTKDPRSHELRLRAKGYEKP